MRLRLRRFPSRRIAAPAPSRLAGRHGVFLLVFLSTFPVVIPFIFMKDIKLALRISNGIAIVLLFLVGYSFGRHIGRHPVWTGI